MEKLKSLILLLTLHSSTRANSSTSLAASVTCRHMVTWASVETDLKMLPAGLASLSLEGCPIPETTLASLLKEPASLSHLAIARSPWTALPNQTSPILPDSLLHGLHNLKSLQLTDSKIANLSLKVFSQLHNLKSLKMTNNSIKILPNKVFEENKNLEDIDLSHNQLEKWPRNGKNPLENLKALNLSFNQLTEIDENSMILNMLNLESIDLSHNLLNGTFVPWMINFRVKRVDLSHNHIAGINVSMEWWNEAFKAHKAYKNFQANFTLNLAGNPLKCDCWMTELKLNLERRPMVMEGKKEENPLDKMFHLVDDEEVRCEDQVPLATLHPGHLTCRLPQEVPGCHSHLSRYLGERVIDCSDANLTRLPSPTLHNTAPGQPIKVRLDMSRNQIKNMAQAMEGLTAVDRAALSHLILTDNSITNFSSHGLAPLTTLALDGNQLTGFTDEDLRFLGKVPNLYLARNPFSCSCASNNLVTFLNRSGGFRVRDEPTLDCGQNRSKLKDLEKEDFCMEALAVEVKVLISGSILVLLAFSITIIWFLFRERISVWGYSKPCIRRIFFQQQQLDEERPYDAFIVHAEGDSQWVEEVLVSGLEEGGPGYKCCYMARDFQVGGLTPALTSQAIDSSRRTIIVLSKGYVDMWPQDTALQAAHSQPLQEATDRVILVVRGEVPDLPTTPATEAIRWYIGLHTYLNTRDPAFWPKLRHKMRHTGGMKAKGRGP